MPWTCGATLFALSPLAVSCLQQYPVRMVNIHVGTWVALHERRGITQTRTPQVISAEFTHQVEPFARYVCEKVKAS